MAVKIRLARIGKKNAPIYRIVAIHSSKNRDGRFLEDLGTYNPKTKEMVQYHKDRIDYWLSCGATPSDTFIRLQKSHSKQTSPAS